MLEVWLVPVVLFWAASALYFGGFERDIAGASGFRGFFGLIVSYVLFLIVWGVVHRFVLPDTVIGIVIASVVAALLVPLEVRAGFMVVGGRVKTAGGH